ncbi:MAG: glycosyltransferase [Gemmataceae bacterium]
MNILHQTASPFYGGPERQMIGLGKHLRPNHHSIYASFAERGQCRPFLRKATEAGFVNAQLQRNAPNYLAAINEITQLLTDYAVDVLCCHGYKPDLLGLVAARRTSTPIVAVSRGWTGATWKVKINEALDKWSLRWMDAVVCVSEGQAKKVRRLGIPPKKVHVIRNAIDMDRFTSPEPSFRKRLQQFFSKPKTYIVGAAGRLSPEKGIGVLVDAAAKVVAKNPDIGFVIFGDGPLRSELEKKIAKHNLQDNLVMPGFRTDLDLCLAAFDVLALPSYTEGLPNVALEAFAARVPVVATAVGGTPEVVADGVSGFLVPAGNPADLAKRILDVLSDDGLRADMGNAGHRHVKQEFTFHSQSTLYQKLFEQIVKTNRIKTGRFHSRPINLQPASAK